MRLRAGSNAPLIKKPKSRLLPIFSPDFTLNSQIWLFYAEKWIFLKKLCTLLKIRNGYTDCVSSLLWIFWEVMSGRFSITYNVLIDVVKSNNHKETTNII